MKNSPMDGIKDSTTPDKSPGSVSRKLPVQKAVHAAATRSLEAYPSEASSFSALEYTARIIKGSSE